MTQLMNDDTYRTKSTYNTPSPLPLPLPLPDFLSLPDPDFFFFFFFFFFFPPLMSMSRPPPRPKPPLALPMILLGLENYNKSWMPKGVWLYEEVWNDGCWLLLIHDNTLNDTVGKHKNKQFVNTRSYRPGDRLGDTAVDDTAVDDTAVDITRLVKDLTTRICRTVMKPNTMI